MRFRPVRPAHGLGLCLLGFLLFATLWRDVPKSRHPEKAVAVDFVPVALPPVSDSAAMLGAFRLESVWEMRSRWRRFGSYSALVVSAPDRLEAFSDDGNHFGFTMPDRAGDGRLEGRKLRLFGGGRRAARKAERDVESATRDPATGTIWLGLEGSNRIVRLSPDLNFEQASRPQAMRAWPVNSGAEAFTRLQDGRFIALSEAALSWWDSAHHEGVLFRQDPVDAPEDAVRFTMEGPRGFAPTAMAQIPDGRVLVLFRRLLWPYPPRFAGKIAIGDPGEIGVDGRWQLKEVAHLGSSLPVDNFEGMAIAPLGGGRLAVWLVADDNGMRAQRALLWKLTVDPALLP